MGKSENQCQGHGPKTTLLAFNHSNNLSLRDADSSSHVKTSTKPLPSWCVPEIRVDCTISRSIYRIAFRRRQPGSLAHALRTHFAPATGMFAVGTLECGFAPSVTVSGSGRFQVGEN